MDEILGVRVGEVQLEVLGRVGVAERRGHGEVVDEHDRGLRTAERGGDALARGACGRPGPPMWAATASASASESVTRTAAACSSCSAWLMRSAAMSSGSAVGVGDDEDLGRAGLGIRPHESRDGALGGRDEVVARTGHDVDRIEAQRVDTVGEGADRTRTAHRVDLVDAEQPRGGEDHRVHAAVELALRRGRQRDLGRRRPPARGRRS